METSEAAVVDIWGQLGDCLREGTSITARKRQSEGPGASIRARQQLSLRGGKPPPAKPCTRRPAGELKAKTNASEQQRQRPCP